MSESDNATIYEYINWLRKGIKINSLINKSIINLNFLQKKKIDDKLETYYEKAIEEIKKEENYVSPLSTRGMSYPPKNDYKIDFKARIIILLKKDVKELKKVVEELKKDMEKKEQDMEKKEQDMEKKEQDMKEKEQDIKEKEQDIQLSNNLIKKLLETDDKETDKKIKKVIMEKLMKELVLEEKNWESGKRKNGKMTGNQKIKTTTTKLNNEELTKFNFKEITHDTLKSLAKEMIKYGLKKKSKHLMDRYNVDDIDTIYNIIKLDDNKKYLLDLYKFIMKYKEATEDMANYTFENIYGLYKKKIKKIDDDLSQDTYGGKKQERIRSNKNKTRRNINKYKKKRLSSKKR